MTFIEITSSSLYTANFRFNNSTQSKATLFIDIKVTKWLFAVMIKTSSPMPAACIPLILNMLGIPLMTFWCCFHCVRHALNLSQNRNKYRINSFENFQFIFINSKTIRNFSCIPCWFLILITNCWNLRCSWFSKHMLFDEIYLYPISV